MENCATAQLNHYKKGGEIMTKKIEGTSIEDAKEKATAFVASAIDIFAQENPTAGVYSMYVVDVAVECQGGA